MAFLEFNDISFKYNGFDECALKNINFKIRQGEFIVICGESGCGKTTLLKLIKNQLAPKGRLTGEIKYNNKNINELTERESVQKIGYVMQNPNNQTVTDKVWHELSFGLESLGLDNKIIRKRIAEMSSFFGITDWYHKKISELSGGQKQLLNLASVMLMSPEILILDEPTSQLDPVIATEFISTLVKINRELNLTVVLAEHRLEEVFPIADKVAIMQKGQMPVFEKPRDVVLKLKEIDENHKMQSALPSAVRIFDLLETQSECPLTVREGNAFLKNNYSNDIDYINPAAIKNNNDIALELSNAWFRYERNTPDILKGLDIKIKENEIYCLLGANGAGKTTVLKVLSAQQRIYRGKFRIFDKKLKEYSKVSLYRNNIAMLPQNPESVFIKSTVEDDLKEITSILKYTREQADIKINEISSMLEINFLLKRHPYDLSGGEQQKCALAKILLLNPKIILLDEPTKGIDAFAKKNLLKILIKLKSMGKTIVIVTHDIEFAAQSAERCGMFFDGQIVSEADPVTFFSGNTFYTTSAHRISRGFFKNAVTVENVVELCRINAKN